MKTKRIKFMLFILLGVVLLPISAKAITATNALTRLEVESVDGGPFTLNGKTTFDFTLYRDSEDVNIIATPAKDTYKVEGAGALKAKEGQNTYTIKVTDPADNSTVVYTINLNKLAESLYTKANSTVGNYDKTATTVKTPATNPPTGIFNNIALLIAVSIGALIVIKAITKKEKFFRI